MRARSRPTSLTGARAISAPPSADLYRQDPHPRARAQRGSDDRTPFLLFPVRLETIFVPISAPGPRRAPSCGCACIPTKSAVHTHEDVLTESEVDAGELYWIELVVAAHLHTERDTRRGAAWRHLVTLFGGHRAAWIARRTRPGDWERAGRGRPGTIPARPAARGRRGLLHEAARPIAVAATRAALDAALAANDGDAFARLAESEAWFDRINAAARQTLAGFPDRGLTKPDAWSRTPRTDCCRIASCCCCTPARMACRAKSSASHRRYGVAGSRSPGCGQRIRQDRRRATHLRSGLRLDVGLRQGGGAGPGISCAAERNRSARWLRQGVRAGAFAVERRGRGRHPARTAHRQSSVQRQGIQPGAAGHADQQHRARRDRLLRQRHLRRPGVLHRRSSRRHSMPPTPIPARAAPTAGCWPTRSALDMRR